MGQAKNRGTFEERKAQAVERNKVIEKKREKADMEYKAKNLKNNIAIIGHGGNRRSVLLAVASALSISSPPITLACVGNRKPK